MKRNRAYSLLASIAVLAVLLSCMLSGVVLPVLAADSEPYTLGGEVLVNGDFSQGASTNWGNTEYYNATAGENNGAGLLLPGDGALAEYRGDVTLKPVTTYMLSFAYFDVANTTFYVESGIECIGRITVNTTGTGEWKTVSHKFTTPVEIVWDDGTSGEGAVIAPGFNIEQGDNEVVDDGSVSGGTEEVIVTPPAALSVVCVSAAESAPLAVDTLSLREYIPTTKADTLVLTDFSDGKGVQNVNRLWMLTGSQRTLNIKLSNSTDTTLACDARSLTWDSSDKTVATVEYGCVTALTVGETEVTATLTDTVSGNPLTVSVTVKVVDGTLSADSDAPFSLGRNLIYDGNFEQGTHTDYWTDPISSSVQENVGRSGGSGLVFSASGQEGNYRKITGIKAATKYAFSFDYLAMPNNEINVIVENLGLGRSSIELGSTADGTWKTVTIVGKTPANLSSSSFRVQCAKLNANAPVVLDNFTLREYTEKTEAESIDLTDKVTLYKGEKTSLVVQATPSEGNLNGTTWTTTNAGVATVKSGYVTAVAAGTATITAKAQSGATASCVVTVTDPAKTTPVDLAADNLTWTGDSGTGQVNPGTPLKFSATISNLGANAVPAGQEVKLDIAMDGTVIRTLTYTGGLAVGASVTVTDSQTWAAVAGDHMMSVRVNADWSIYETDAHNTALKNNTYQVGLRVANDRIEPSEWAAESVIGAGMDRLTFSDDFNSLDTFDTAVSGREGYKWYMNLPNSRKWKTTADYHLDDGILTIIDQAGSNLTLSSADCDTRTGYTFNKGYMEIRFQIVNPSGHPVGKDPGIWAFPERKMFEISGENDRWVEMDWMEYWGISSRSPDGNYSITIHDSYWTDSGAKTDQNSNYSKSGLGDGEWHTMGWLWEHNRLVTFLDGEEVLHLIWADDATAVPGAGVIGQYTLAHINEDSQVLILGSGKNNPMKVDYVRIWQESEPETVSNTMALSQTDVTMYENDQEKLTVSVPTGEDAGTLSWTTSDPSVVTVHGDGILYARKAGAATVSATNVNGVTVLCNVTVKHNLMTGGDFELEPNEDLLGRHWTNIFNAGMSIVEDSTDTDSNDGINHVLKISKVQGSSNYLRASFFEANTTYRMSGRVRSDSTWKNRAQPILCLGSRCYVSNVSTEWQSFSFEFSTNDGPINDSQRTYGISIGQNAGTNNRTGEDVLYLDNLVITKVENAPQDTYALTVGDMENGSVSLTANGVAVTSGQSIAPGTRVNVTVNPSSDYRLRLGSLETETTIATCEGRETKTRAVLNKPGLAYLPDGTIEKFGEGKGNEFYFTMPEGATTLNAVFESTTSIDTAQLPAATLGTSAYKNSDTVVEGVRFLNRVYARIDQENGAVYVNYAGTEHKVTEFGSLLKRADNVDGELTLEDHAAHGTDSPATRIWKTTAYSATDNKMTLVDYTTEYVDFTVVMTSKTAQLYSFVSQEYTTCAYIMLENGTTLYTEPFTDSVVDALARIR